MAHAVLALVIVVPHVPPVLLLARSWAPLPCLPGFRVSGNDETATENFMLWG